MSGHMRTFVHLKADDKVSAHELSDESVYVSFGEDVDLFAPAELMESMLVEALMGVQAIIDAPEER